MFNLSALLAAKVAGGKGGSAGGVSSWNDLTDKPFYEETTPGINIEWDGNKEGHEVINMGAEELVKVSDEVFSADTLDLTGNWSVVFVDNTSVFTYNKENVLAGLEVITGNPGVDLYAVTVSDNNFLQPACVVHENVDADGLFLTKGVWFLCGENYYVQKLTIPGTTVIHKLDEKYLPDALQFGDVEVTFVEEQSFTPSSEAPVALGTADTPQEGATVTVVFDGEKYTAEVINLFDMMCIGNLGLVGMEDTGEPFFLMWVEGVAQANASDTTRDHTISVFGKKVVELPPKYYSCYEVLSCSQNISEDPYVFTNLAAGTKATLDDVKAVLLRKRNIVLEDGLVHRFPIVVDIYSNEYATIYAMNKDGTINTYYTAEYTA